MKRELTPYQKEALDFTSNILLTANAGSGKTFVLAKRFIEILLNENTELENIVAITFTDKAAGELNKKISIEMELRTEIENDDVKRKKLQNARRQLVSANISTIHSFCINILKEFAPEAGIDVNFVPIDQNTSDELIEQSVDETVNHLISDAAQSENLKYLVRFFGSKQVVLNHLTTAIYQRKTIDQHLKEIYNSTQNEIAEYYQNKFERIFKTLFDQQIIETLGDINEVNNAVLAQPKGNEIAVEIAKIIKDYRQAVSLKERFEVLKKTDINLFTQKGEVKNRGYLCKNRDDFESQIARIENTFSSLRPFLKITEPESAAIELARFGKIFIKVYEHAAGIYFSKKHQKGFLDFEDILLFTLEIIKLEEVHEYLRNKFKYIMIDEYQDTNEIQYKIFMPVLDDLKHGNLFVVGDEKQSIYMFRDADLRVFNKTKNDIELNGSGGKLLNLPHSFRMAPQLVLFTNKLFEKLFENPKELFNEVEYNNLICAKDANEKARVEFLLADREIEVTEAGLVANKILELIGNGETELNEIGILCRKRNLFKELENEFVKQNIPYTIVGGKGFYQRQTIYDIYNYLSFILNNDDDAALIGILRAPFYNLPDTELYRISMEEGKSFYNKLKKHAAVEPALNKVINQLNEHSGLGFNTEIYSLIRIILLQSGYWAVVASKKKSDQELANLEKLLVLARSFSQKSFKTLYDFTTFLHESIETMEDEGQAQIVQGENTVKLLTIHQAKGLEFKAVFLYGCNGYSMEDSVKTKGLNIDKDFGLIAKVPLNNNYFGEYVFSPTAVLYNYINHKKNSAEIKRLLYVAVTRAMNFLFISAAHKEYNSLRDSFFELVVEGLRPDFTGNEKFLNGAVTFMKGSDDNYDKYEKNVELTIKFVKENIDVRRIEQNISENVNKIKFLTQSITDMPEKEIISATKISIYTQCPVKYELTYDLGYSTIFNIVKKQQNDFEFNNKEDDDSRAFADVKGRIIHNILKDDFKIETLDCLITNNIAGQAGIDPLQADELKQSIINDLKLFLSSKTYKELLEHKTFKNELEVYCEQGEHYLFGIIDKLIFEKDRLIICDYKTDNIESGQVKYRAQSYFPQLKFYAYILTKLYREYSNYELRIIFIKHPEEPVEVKTNRIELETFGSEINDAVNKIILREYKPNLDHCGKCHFALEGNKCIKF